MLSLLVAGLQPGLFYTATEVVADPIEAGMNSHGLVAGIHQTGQGQTEAFVWQDGKIVWHSPRYTMMAGPNEKGQVAFGNDKGLYRWEKGQVEPCRDVVTSSAMVPTKVPNKIVSIDEDGRIVAIAEGIDNAYAILTWPKTPSIVKSTDGGPSILFRPAAILGKVVAGTSISPFSPSPSVPQGTCFVRIADQFATIGGTDTRPVPTAVASDGTVVGYLNTNRLPFAWKAGTLNLLPLPPGNVPDHPSIGEARSVNKHGDVAGFADWQIRTTRGLATETQSFHRACLWQGGQVTDLSPLIKSDFAWEAEEAWRIDDKGVVLAMGRKSRLSEESLLILSPNRS